MYHKCNKQVVTTNVMTVTTGRKKTQMEQKNDVSSKSSPNRSGTYDFLVTSPDALPQSYRKNCGIMQ